jgi:hypothetical protein
MVRSEETTYVLLDESNLSLSLSIDERLCLVCSLNLVFISTLQFVLLRSPGRCSPLFSIHVLLFGISIQLFGNGIGRRGEWDGPESDRLDLGRGRVCE